jgi:hypothetical protein
VQGQASKNEGIIHTAPQEAQALTTYKGVFFIKKLKEEKNKIKITQKEEQPLVG